MLIDNAAIPTDRQNRQAFPVIAATRNECLNSFKLVRPALFGERRESAIDRGGLLHVLQPEVVPGFDKQSCGRQMTSVHLRRRIVEHLPSCAS